MNDNNDGTYTLDYTVLQPGTVSVNFELVNQVTGGLLAEYFDNNSANPSNVAGVPTHTKIESEINHDWGTGTINPATGNSDNVAVRWSGFLIPPYSEFYTFYVQANEALQLYLDG